MCPCVSCLRKIYILKDTKKGGGRKVHVSECGLIIIDTL